MPERRPGGAGTAGGLGCAWSGGGGGGVPAPVFEELGEVVDGAEELDLGVDGVAAAVADVAAEPGEQLGEGGFDEAGAAFVQFLAGWGGEPGVGRHTGFRCSGRLAAPGIPMRGVLA